MVKTLILNGTEVKAAGPDGDNAEIHNFGGGTVYASKLPNITANADNVIAISPGAIDGLTGTHGTVYLLGTGKVQVNFTDEKVTRTPAAQSGGTWVSMEYVDEKDAEALAAAKDYADGLNADLAGYVGYTGDDIYGLEADFENCVFTRLAGAVGKNPGADFDSVRAYGGRRRCNLSDSGEVLAYYGDESFKADGSNGQVMVEQPRFYYKVVPLKTEKIDGADGYHLRKARYYISDTPKAGFKVHPAFVRNGVEVDRIYLSAFEGCIYDISTGAYLLEDEQVADFGADKLSSIAGAKPCSGKIQQLTRANARKLAHNRGEGWEQATIQAVAATQMLFVIEYAAFNSQTSVGSGNTAKNGNADEENVIRTGATAALGNTSGTALLNNEHNAVSYRGEENFWGNIYKWLDGINVYNFAYGSQKAYGKVFIADHDFKDSSNSSPYSDIGICIYCGNGYPSAFSYSPGFDWSFIPAECKGNSSKPIGDFFRNGYFEWRVGMHGRSVGGTVEAGVFCLNFNFSDSGRAWYNSARPLYIPVPVKAQAA